MVLGNVMFIHIPKAAGSSIEKSLGLVRARTPGKFNRWFTGEGQYSFGHIDVRVYLAKRKISQEFYKSAFKFAFCRNPYDRAVSHYFYARKRHPDKFSPSVSFIDFSRTLGNYGKMFRLQSWYTEGLKFNFIGRFERLESDIKKVSDLTGIRLTTILDINKTRHAPYWNYYNEESKQNIEKFYKKDFEVFGYQQEDDLLSRQGAK